MHSSVIELQHFIDGRPTPAHPDPLPALTYDRSNVTPAKRPAELQTVSVPSRKRLRDDCHLDDAEDIRWFSYTKKKQIRTTMQ